MLRYIGLRLALFIPTLLIASIVIFTILRVLPGDVVDVVLGGSGEVAHDPDPGSTGAGGVGAG